MREKSEVYTMVLSIRYSWEFGVFWKGHRRCTYAAEERVEVVEGRLIWQRWNATSVMEVTPALSVSGALSALHFALCATTPVRLTCLLQMFLHLFVHESFTCACNAIMV